MLLPESAGEVKPVDPIRDSDAGPSKPAQAAPPEKLEDRGLDRGRGDRTPADATRHAEVFPGETNRGNREFGGQLAERAHHDRMEVQVQVAVDVRQGKARLAEPLELGADLPAELAAGRGAGLVDARRPGGAVPKAAVRVDQVGNLSGRQDRAPRDDHQVQSDRESRVRARERDRLLPGVARDHEARAREDAAFVRLDDRAVDAAREAEVVAGDDELSQTRSSRPRRNRKNSTPFAQAALQHLRGSGHLDASSRASFAAGNRSACRTRSSAVEDLLAREVRVGERADLDAVVADESVSAAGEPAVVDAPGGRARCPDRAPRARPGSCAD